MKFFCASSVKKSHHKEAKQLRRKNSKNIFASLCASAVKNSNRKDTKELRRENSKTSLRPFAPLRLNIRAMQKPRSF
jgi:hypothetical protein